MIDEWCRQTFSDGVSTRIVDRTTYKTQAHRHDACSAECRPGDDQFRSHCLPNLLTIYETAHSRWVRVHNWYLVDKILSITEVSLHWFLHQQVCTLWVGSGTLHIFSLRTSRWSAYLLGVALISEFLEENWYRISWAKRILMFLVIDNII